jgi:molecular chaperone Hsp33
VVPLVSGEIGDDLASYLVASEQAPAALGVGVWVERDGAVGAAGGYLVQALPGADPEALEALAARIEAAPSPSTMVREGVDAAGMLDVLLGDVAQPPLDVRPVRFRCRCSATRVRTAVLAMGQEEIADVLARERRVEATCEFCGTAWVVDEAELRQLLG